MKKIFIILPVLLSLHTSAQMIFMRQYRAASWGEIRINFTNSTQSIPTYNSLDPSNASFSTLVSGAGAVYTSPDLADTNGVATGVTLSTISTINWYEYDATHSNKNNATGVTGGTYFPGLTTAGYQSYWFNYGLVTPARYDATKPQIRLSGLDPSATYTVKIGGSDGLGFTAKWVVRIVGLTSPSAIEVDGDQASVTTGASFTLQPKVDGTMDILINTSTTNSGDLATFCAMIITKN